MKDLEIKQLINHLQRKLRKRKRSSSSSPSDSAEKSSKTRSPSTSSTRPKKRPSRRRCRVISDDSSETNEDGKENNEIERSEDCVVLDNDIEEVFGEDPTLQKEFGEDIHPHVAVRWTNILQKGINNRADIIKKHLTPSNCNFILAPKLNHEIKGAAQDTAVKRDNKLEQKQNQLGVGITCVGKAINEAFKIDNKDIRKQILQHLGDAGQILTDLHYQDTMTRRSLLNHGLNKISKEAAKDLPRDRWLYSEVLQDKLKAAKACSKSAADIKIKQPKPTPSRPRLEARAPISTPEALNWRGSSRRSAQNTMTAGSYQRRPTATAGPSVPRRVQTSQRRPPAKRF